MRRCNALALIVCFMVCLVTLSWGAAHADTQNVAKLVPSGNLHGAYAYRGVAVVDNFAYVTSRDGGYLIVYDLAGLAESSHFSGIRNEVAFLKLGKSVTCITHLGNHLYIGGESGLYVVSIENKQAPKLVRHVKFGSLISLKVNGATLIAIGLSDSCIFSISNPSNPVLLKRFGMGHRNSDAAVFGKVLYVTEWGDSSGVRVYDMSSITNITEVTFIPFQGTLYHVAVTGDTLFVAVDKMTTSSLFAYGLKQPTNPVLKATVNLPVGGRAFGISSHYAVLCGGGNGRIIDTATSSMPIVGFITDQGGTVDGLPFDNVVRDDGFIVLGGQEYVLVTRMSTSTHADSAQDSQSFYQYVVDVRNHLYKDKFALLDRTASQIRTEKSRFPGGAWKLGALYGGLSTPPFGEKASEAEWKTHIEKLRTWERQSPDSITARVALGISLVEFAWKARGGGYSDTTTDRGMQLFKDRLDMAEEVLNSARKLRETCPHWYLVMLQIGLAQGWELSRFNQVFEQGTAVEPMYYYLYRLKAMFLMPRWYGKPGDWERFAEETYRSHKAREGAILYFLIASHMHDYYGDSFFKETSISWPRMKEGFAYLEKDYGVDNELLNEACKLAVLAGDRTTAKMLFDKIADNWQYSVWETMNKFESSKAWSHQPTGSR